jgi:hypothetical protein
MTHGYTRHNERLRGTPQIIPLIGGRTSARAPYGGQRVSKGVATRQSDERLRQGRDALLK